MLSSNKKNNQLIEWLISIEQIKSLVRFLAKPPFLRRVLIKLYFLLNNNLAELKFYTQSINDSEQKIITIYSNAYPGVRYSTESIFSNRAELILNSPKSFGEVLSNHHIKHFSQLLANESKQVYIFSGGTNSILDLITALRGLLNSNQKIYYIWHGSPAQWTDTNHLQHFNLIMDLYNKGIIDSIVTVKKDLDLMLQNIGVKSIFLQNFVVNYSYINEAIQSKKNDKFTVGIWSAYDSWIKNLYPQLLALTMQKDYVCYTNFQFQDINTWIKQKLQLISCKANLNHEELLSLISKTDVTLYVTNTECSPMIALESLGVGVPVIVGPASGLYDDDEYLKNFLTVEKVDCVATINRKLQYVRDN